MNKSIILIVFLITYSICDDDCTSLSTETSCTAKSGCKWTAGITCTGDDSCTSKTASETECTETKYTPKIKCIYTAVHKLLLWKLLLLVKEQNMEELFVPMILILQLVLEEVNVVLLLGQI